MSTVIDIPFTISPVSTSLTLHFCGWQACLPSHSFGPAIRPHFLIHLILKGKGYYYVGETKYSLQAGEMFLIMPGVTTYYEADELDPWEYCWIGFDGLEAKRILDYCGLNESNLIKTVSSCGELKKYLLDMVRKFENGITNEFERLSYLYHIFSLLTGTDEDHNVSISANYLALAKVYIHNNYSYDIKITDIAKYIGIDRTYLYRLFIKENNISPQQYLIQYRLSISKHMLENTNHSMMEIIYSCGFQDLPSFYKHFKKSFGLTPGQYKLYLK